VDGLNWQAVFDAVSGLVGFGHMSGLLARRFLSAGLMKSDGLGADSDEAGHAFQKEAGH
jgi:hypothetical protein